MRCHRIRQRRERLGLSQGAMADAAGLKHQTYVGLAERWDAGQPAAIHPETAANHVKRIRRALVERESASRREREHARRAAAYARAEIARIEHQRALWAAVPESPEKAALERAMIERAVDLMHENSGEEADALFEFLPERRVEAELVEWWVETFPEDKRTALPVPIS
jgi:transcriptional regulator with XRE-family HTH domain